MNVPMLALRIPAKRCRALPPARRHQALARLAGRLRGEPAEHSLVRTLDEVTDELDWRGQRYLGLQTIRLDTIAGLGRLPTRF